jgi:hypothetical protein
MHTVALMIFPFVRKKDGPVEPSTVRLLKRAHLTRAETRANRLFRARDRENYVEQVCSRAEFFFIERGAVGPAARQRDAQEYNW